MRTLSSMFCLSLSLFIASALGCVRHHGASPDVAAVAKTQSLPAHPTDCAVDEKHFSQKTNLIAGGSASADIQRLYQNVVHRDCSGATVKQGIEEVQAPTKLVNYQLPMSTSQVGAVRLFNDTTCDWSTAILTEKPKLFHLTDRLRGTTNGQLQITLDASVGVTSFHVKPGVNVIYYTTYTQCVPDSERHTTIFEPCPMTLELTSGTIVVNVNDSESTLPGDKIVSDCSAAETQGH